MTPGTCKNCKAPIADDDNGFCDQPDDACWHQWCAKTNKEIAAPGGIPATFTAGGHAFTQQEGSLVWLAPDGWRFWLGEEVKAGVWTMGADRGQGESVFAFGIFDGVEECFAELERLTL